MILDLSTGRFFGLNPTAAQIWDHLVQGADPATVVKTLSTELGADRAVICADVNRFITALCDRGLIRQNGEQP